ncbi:MAG: pyrroline-5-carboxylate reductase [Clostridia bacterium]|nr:pyrroline-5-carboxylate reductase [Clostridia bacterium]MBN2882455.1 pyrroline-5-carboxylate reductase [Clostridia bacterium]
MSYKIAIIGVGNMGGSLAKAVARNLKGSSVFIFDRLFEKVRDLIKYGCIATAKIVDACRKADIIILAVKPNVIPQVLSEIKDELTDKLLISIAAGLKIETYEETIPGVRFIRAMPNMAVAVSEGMNTLVSGNNATEEDIETARKIFEATGEVVVINESLMDIATALAGSSPAYVFMFIEAMADAGVSEGLSRKTSYKMAAQAVMGSAKLLLESNENPGTLKDMICSPGGTTIEAVLKLEEEGFRNAIIKAVRACTDKSRKLAEK